MFVDIEDGPPQGLLNMNVAVSTVLPLNSIALMVLDAYVWDRARLKYER